MIQVVLIPVYSRNRVINIYVCKYINVCVRYTFNFGSAVSGIKVDADNHLELAPLIKPPVAYIDS